ncbi:FAD:protein FMN transferase [Tunturiibacter lichenicola]|uniref:FAD:protein FMN transferase n=1 Tax=Tunturiibacter lichenicola TaxID=2051959 RepID=UPI003D9B1E6C
MIRTLRAATILVASTLLVAGSGLAQPEPRMLFHDVHRAMGSEFSIDLYAPNQETADRWMQLSFEEVDRIEKLLSNYRPSSELSRISREAGTHPVTIDPETFDFLQTSVSWSSRSNGAFDITVGPIMRAWGFFFNQGRIPSEAELLALKRQTGWTNIHLDASARTVSFINGSAMELDPGGIGKGYAVDRIVALLHQEHVSAALISAGSSTIYAIGAPPGSQGWPINIADPARSGRILSTVLLTDTSLSTSACTEKFFIKNGHRYCHILDPHTMHPIENMLQTTVIAPSATDSDALTKAMFVMRADASARLLQDLPQTAAVIVSGTPDSPSYRAIQWPNPLQTRHETKQEEGIRTR